MPHHMPNTLKMAGACDKSAPTLLLQTSMDMTFNNTSPCDTLTCEYCLGRPSVKGTASMSSRTAASNVLAANSAQAILATMGVAEPPVDHESSDLVRRMMADARARAGFVPGASASKAASQPPLPLTTEQQDFDDSAEAAATKSSTLIAALQAQLAAPKVAPAGVSEEEKQEITRNHAWDLQHKLKNESLDGVSKRNAALLEDMTTMVDNAAQKRGRIPNCDDFLTWESNANSAGTQPRTKARSNAGRAAVNPIDILEGQALTWQNVWKFEMSYGW